MGDASTLVVDSGACGSGGANGLGIMRRSLGDAGSCVGRRSVDDNGGVSIAKGL